MNAEHLRLLHNIATVGTVLEVNPPKMRLAIGENETDWVTIPAMAAGNVKVWRCPTIGEQFVIVSPSGDHRNARPICALPSDVFTAPSNDPNEVHISFNDTDFLSINTESSQATFKIGKLTLDIGEIQLTGSLTAQDIIKSLTDVLADSISLKNHKTTGVKAGGDLSGGPQ